MCKFNYNKVFLGANNLELSIINNIVEMSRYHLMVIAVKREVKLYESGLIGLGYSPSTIVPVLDHFCF